MQDEPATAIAASALLRGRILVLVSGMFMSLGGLFIRSVEAADEWQILFWRSVGLAVALLVFIFVRNGRDTWRRFREAGASAMVGGLCLSAGFICFVFSMTHTTVANTLFMLSAGPFMTAILGRLLLGEAVRRATWIAMAAAGIGIAVMMGESLAVGDPFGNIMGLGAALSFAAFAVALRWGGRNADMMPATCFAGLFAAAAAGAALAVQGGSFAVSQNDLVVCVAYGVVGIGIALIIFTTGARLVAAAELVLLSLTEVVLGPVWVWLVYAETPSLPTLLGGVILLGAIAGQALTGMRRPRPPMGVV